MPRLVGASAEEVFLLTRLLFHFNFLTMKINDTTNKCDKPYKADN